MSTSSTPQFRAALLITKLKILLVLAAARVIYNALLANVASFPLPVPTLVVLLAQINALDAAQQVVQAKPHPLDAVSARNSARDLLWTSLKSLRSYVQTLADAAGEGGATLIKSAGMNVAQNTAAIKPILQVKLTATPGVVSVIGNALALRGTSKKAVTYLWQYSVDGGHTWVLGNTSGVAHSTLSGLPLLTYCLFRVAVSQDGVTGDWSPMVTLLVH